jgi:hypothetical protein
MIRTIQRRTLRRFQHDIPAHGFRDRLSTTGRHASNAGRGVAIDVLAAGFEEFAAFVLECDGLRAGGGFACFPRFGGLAHRGWLGDCEVVAWVVGEGCVSVCVG